ncbi:MAG: WG repeat-containing protein [Clostridia bacterium]|nr:WG repeat-containing protein [Clostridia bacterium]
MSEDITRYVEAAAQGDIEAIGKLYAKTLKSSYYLALRLSNDADEAAEITKNAYARVFCTVARLKKPEAFEIYMRQNIAAVYKETQKFTFTDAVSDVPESALEFLSEDVYEDEAKAAAAVNSVASLSPEMRSAVVLHYFSGMPVGPISRYLNVSESTANSVLSRAKEIIFRDSGSQTPLTVSSAQYPVLNRVFKRDAEDVYIDGVTVRDMFAYVVEKYNIYKQAEIKKNPSFGQGLKKTDETGVNIPAKSSDNELGAYNFKKINDNDMEVTDVPSMVRPKSGFEKFVDNAKSFISDIPSKLKKYNPKFLAVCGAGALALLILIIVLCAVLGGRQKKADVEVKWQAGGFEDCAEIKYINEYFCSFKATNNKYGLMDYEGNVLVQPAYDSQFVNCSLGKDYSEANGGSGMYHVYVNVNGTKTYAKYSNGTVEISEQHPDHPTEHSELDKDFKYEERDRFFEGLAAAQNKKGKWGYIDDTGKEVIPFDYDAVNTTDKSNIAAMDVCRPFTDGYVAVMKDGKMAIINKDNELVTDFEYSEILAGKNGVFIAKKDGKWGFILVGDAVKNFKSSGPEIVTTTAPQTDENGEIINTDAIGKHYKVVGDGANVRRTPGSKGEWIGSRTPGSIVEGIAVEKDSRGREWLKIEVNGGGFGYISMGLLEEVK